MEGDNKIDIQHPEAWDLLVAIGNRQVNYILYAPTVAGSLVIGAVERADDTLQALEDAVYATPVLLNEYKWVRVVLNSPHFVLLPPETPDKDAEAMLQEAFPGEEGEVAVCQLQQTGLKIAYLLPQGMKAFLGRTFSYPETYHHLMPLCEHFMSQYGGDRPSRMFLNLQAGTMNLFICRDGMLQCANTYWFSSAEDAVYYAMSAWRAHGMDQLTDEMLLMGDLHECGEMTPLLREYVKSVMPAEFPVTAMRLGRNALQAPLDLILLALCE